MQACPPWICRFWLGSKGNALERLHDRSEPNFMKPINLFIETGKKRTFASALDWPGWSRGARDEESALQALVDCSRRYAQVVQLTGLDFQPPRDGSSFVVIERSEGDATTDFGAPSIIATADKGAIDRGEFDRLSAILEACWKTFDSTTKKAQGKELRKGPRGGGRDLEKIREHVLGAEQGYLRSLGWKAGKSGEKELAEEVRQTREAIVAALEAAVRGELPEQGLRGGKVWPPRYFVRRVAWHLLDHAWEVEDRMV